METRAVALRHAAARRADQAVCVNSSTSYIISYYYYMLVAVRGRTDVELQRNALRRQDVSQRGVSALLKKYNILILFVEGCYGGLL